MSEKLCKYGCGKIGIKQLKSGEWICSTDHRKCPENRKKYSQPGDKNPMHGRHQSKSAKKKIGEKSKLKVFSKSYREKLRNNMVGNDRAKGLVHSKETRNKMSMKQKGKVLSEDHKKKIGLTHKGKIISKEQRKKLSIAHKKLYQDPEFLKKMRKCRLNRPTTPEKLLMKLLRQMNLSFDYVGDFSKWINGKNPDFINEEDKKIIEVFGEYWHSKEITGKDNHIHENERKLLFSSKGYDTLIIWDYEFNDINKLKNKLNCFMRS